MEIGDQRCTDNQGSAINQFERNINKNISESNYIERGNGYRTENFQQFFFSFEIKQKIKLNEFIDKFNVCHSILMIN